VRALLSALLAGLIFGVGLCISGMSDPEKVLAFLDFSGNWSPRLMGVMLSAILVHAAWLRWLVRDDESAPTSIGAPPAGRRRIDAALLGGSALFGAGWGLAGYCPGPSVVALGTFAPSMIVFVLAALAGMALHRGLVRSSQTPTSK